MKYPKRDECLEDYRHQKKKGLVLKLDLEKAYYYTDRNFLDYIVNRRILIVNRDHG